MISKNSQPALSLDKITHRYNGVLALNQISLQVPAGSFTAVLGPNGAGKTTLAMLMGGMLRPSAGTISVNGSDRTRVDSGKGFIKLGVALVPEGRRLFTQLSVKENLLLGAYGAGQNKVEIKRSFDQVLQFIPELQRHLEKLAGSLSGGERQFLAVGRALMAKPSTVILDEPSLGLAPKMIERVYESIWELNRQSVTVIVIEQIATFALQHAENMIVLEHGKIHYQGSVTSSAANEALKAGYLGESQDSAPDEVKGVG